MVCFFYNPVIIELTCAIYAIIGWFLDTLVGMRLFNRVVEDGSFSAAGRKLGLAPSSVSRQVSALEKGLGARLLNRTTRKVSLTEAGALYFERTRRILTEIDETNDAVGAMQTAPAER